MKKALIEYIITQVTSPKEEEVKEILSIFEEKQFKKGEFFKEPFQTGNHIAFLSVGAVRLIIYKENGDEITARIRQENSFIADPFRLKGTNNSPLGIECLEDLTLLTASLEKVQKLLETNLALNIVVRKHQKEQLLEMANNHYLFIAGSARERYQFILKNNPELIKKFPQSDLLVSVRLLFDQ